jgi:hypothetical protein
MAQQRIGERAGWLEIREALAEVQCSRLFGEPRHQRENGGADARQL